MKGKIALKDLTPEERQDLLGQLQKEEKKAKEARKREKAAYEKDRNNLVIDMVADALDVYEILRAFKNQSIQKMNEFAERANAYGDVRSNSKGGFSLRSSDGSKKVAMVRNIKVEYDERADMGEELIRGFLADMVKKSDKAAYETIIDLLERTANGDFNPASVATLIKKEDRWDDERWTKGIQLFKESHNVVLISMNIEFYVKDSMKKDKQVVLTFASIPVDEPELEAQGS